MGRYNVPGFCAHCSAVKSAHHRETKQCMKNGTTALFGHTQEWEDTTCEIVDAPAVRIRNAGPDLLEALIAIRDVDPDGFRKWSHGYDDAIRKAEAAIAKATGQPG